MGFWTGKRVLITGGGGFFGSHVVEKLRTRDAASLYVARQRDYDLTREEQVVRLFVEHSSDIVVHLAGYVGGLGANKARPADFYYRNLMMNTLTLHHAWKSGVRQVVTAASGCGYPDRAPLPMKESDLWNGLPEAASAPYALAKRMLHTQALAYWRQHRFLTTVVVPGNLYGPYDNFDLENAHVIAALTRKVVEAVDGQQAQLVVWGSGRPTRDFVYAGDVAAGLLRAAEAYREPELVNLSSGQDTSIAEVVRTLVDLTGFRGEVVWDASRPDGQARRLLDARKAQADLGWQATTSLRDGLAKTLAWYRAQRD